MTRRIMSAGLLLSLLSGAAFTMTSAMQPHSDVQNFAVACWLASLLWAMARRQVRTNA